MEPSWNSTELDGTPWKCIKTPWNSMGSTWIPWNLHGIPWGYFTREFKACSKKINFYRVERFLKTLAHISFKSFFYSESESRTFSLLYLVVDLISVSGEVKVGD